MKENDGRNPTESSSKSTEKRGAVLTEDGVGAATTESKPMQHEEKSSEAVDEPKKGAFTKPGARRKKKEKRKKEYPNREQPKQEALFKEQRQS